MLLQSHKQMEQYQRRCRGVGGRWVGQVHYSIRLPKPGTWVCSGSVPRNSPRSKTAAVAWVADSQSKSTVPVAARLANLFILGFCVT